jgi:hypothetical protein
MYMIIKIEREWPFVKYILYMSESDEIDSMSNCIND